MAPRASQRGIHPAGASGMFYGIAAFLIPDGVQTRRLQVWKQKLCQMGAQIEDRFSKSVTHIFASDSSFILQRVDSDLLSRFSGSVLNYQWLEDSLRMGRKAADDMYNLKLDLHDNIQEIPCEEIHEPTHGKNSGFLQLLPCKKSRTIEDTNTINKNPEIQSWDSVNSSSSTGLDVNPVYSEDVLKKDVEYSSTCNIYCPPDLNVQITEIFSKLINIYRALGDDRRSFSYHKAVSVIEKLPFKIERSEDVEGIPTIGKSLKNHIQEIISTGKLAKLDHFEKDEKVKTLSLFGEVWGIGPAISLRLYRKGYRTLDDLKMEDSLTHAQKMGLKYFDDIQKRIPRHEAREMELILKKAGEDVLPGVVIVCGGSFRRGKASCGDLDIVMTHPDGESHRGFLRKYVKHLKDANFLREDLIFSVHSEEGTDSMVDTYFGFCTYPGRELRHRIDLKVYPKDMYAFGLIAWTGNDVLNRRLRLLAESKGYSLDDTGLFIALEASSEHGKKAGRYTSVRFNTEKEVFDFLGFPWLEPHQRNL